MSCRVKPLERKVRDRLSEIWRKVELISERKRKADQDRFEKRVEII